MIFNKLMKKKNSNNFPILGSESRTTNDVLPSSAQIPLNTPQIITVTEKVVDEPKTEKTTERTTAATVADVINIINNNNKNKEEESGNLPCKS